MAKDYADDILAGARAALRRLEAIPDERVEGPRAELAELLDLLATVLGEMRHRRRNSVATLSSALEHFRATAATADELAAEFRPILELYSRDRLVGDNRLPAREMFGTLLKLLLEPYIGYHPNRVILGGPPVEVSGNVVHCLSLIVPELATNAIKHGAIGPIGGRVRANWSVVERYGSRQLRFDWHEECDSALPAPNPDKGGSQLLLIDVPRLFGVSVKNELHPRGVRYEFGFQLRAVPGSDSTGAAAARLLLVEDELALRSFLADNAERAGFEVVEAASVAEALESLGDGPFDLAVVDRTLHDETSFAVADRLMELNIPFVFSTGDSDADDWGAYQGVPRFIKGRGSPRVEDFLENFLKARRGVPDLS